MPEAKEKSKVHKLSIKGPYPSSTCVARGVYKITGSAKLVSEFVSRLFWLRQ